MTPLACNPHAARHCRAAIAVLALASTAFLHGQAAPLADAPDARTLAKYDKNGNGRLDPDEAAARQADEAAAASVAAPGTAAQSGDIVQLSPFQVTADDDKGYLAANTMSGTRLKSRIEDLGASITVVTKQQMEDFAVLDINDIFMYEANTEGIATFTSLTVDRNGGVTDNVQSSPQTANRIRGFDTANTARDGFPTISQIPIDVYNTDRVELSRGPNSSLFGLGNASGTVNVIPTRALVNRQVTNLSLRGDSYGGYRSSLDVNRPIIKDKFAVRVSALYQSAGYERKPSTDITRRQQGTFTIKPFKSTVIQGTYERYSNYARRPNAVTPRDSVTDWRAHGSPTWDPTTRKVTINGVEQATVYPQSQDNNLPLGLIAAGTGFYNRPSIFVDQGAIQFWSVNRTGTVPTSGTFNGIPTPDNPNQDLRFLESANDLQRQRGTLFPLYVSPSITDKSLYDWTSVNLVAPNYFKNKADIYNVLVEQTFLNTDHHWIGARAGWMREDFDSYSRNFISGTSADLYVDVNAKLLDGRPNPYFLRPYIAASEPTLFDRPVVNDTQSADLAYQFKPSGMPKWLNWFGRQLIAGHGEVRRLDTGTYRYRDAVLDDHTWINPLNRTGVTAARAYYKYYVGDSQAQNVDYAPPAIYGLGGRYDLNWFNAKTNQWVAEPALIGQTGVTPSNRTRREIRTIGMATQNFFWGDRIVTTFGWRKDKNRSRDSSGAVVDPATGLLDYSPLRTWGSWVEKSGNTKTAGVVVKPLRNIRSIDQAADERTGAGSYLAKLARSVSLYYNQSDSFLPENTAYNLFGELLPNPTGKGKDYGVSFSLMENKLYVKLNRYDALQKNIRAGDAGIVATRAIRMDTGRSGAGNDSFNFETWASNLAIARFTAQGVVPTAAQLSSAVAKIMQLPEGFLDSLVGKSIAETSDQRAKGWELEVNYNPTRDWTLKLTGAQQNTIDTNISPRLQEYIDQRLPVWTTVKDDAGVNWWTSRIGSGGIPQTFYIGNVSAPLKLAIANQGKPRSQVRQYRFNALTNYKFTHGRLNGLSVGGAVRWEDKAAIGFLGGPPDSDGVVRTLDGDKPVYDSARAYVDFTGGYRFKMFRNRISTLVQLNVRNAFESGRLQAVAVNPDGRPFAYRIVDPRQFILTVTFDL